MAVAVHHLHLDILPYLPSYCGRHVQWANIERASALFVAIYAMAAQMHAIHNKRCPAYLADVVQPVGVASTRTGLCSADSSSYSLPRLNTRVGERAFAYAGPATWNQLPKSICMLQTTSFKHKLKTFFFEQCYNSADCFYYSLILIL